MGVSGGGGGGGVGVVVVGVGGGLGVGGGVTVTTGDVGGGRGIVAMSSWIDLRAIGVFTGVKRLRNWRLRSERRPDPSTRT